MVPVDTEQVGLVMVDTGLSANRLTVTVAAELVSLHPLLSVATTLKLPEIVVE